MKTSLGEDTEQSCEGQVEATQMTGSQKKNKAGAVPGRERKYDKTDQQENSMVGIKAEEGNNER